MRSLVLVVSVGLIAAACVSSGKVQPVPQASADRTIRSDTLRIVEVPGSFRVVMNPMTRREQFVLSLREPAGAGRRPAVHIALARYGAGRPEVDVYPLTAPDTDRRKIPFYAAVSEARGDTTRSWVSVEGGLRVTASSPEHVAGTFAFTGVLYHARPSSDPRYLTGNLGHLYPDAPRLEVVGSFSVPRYEDAGRIDEGLN